MYGILFRAAVYAPIAVFFALILEELLGATVDIMNSAPDSGDAVVIGYTQAAADNFLFLCILSLLIMVLARAVVEARLGGGA